MPRDDALLVDMLVAVKQINEYTAGLSLEQFRSQQKTQDAVIRQLLVLGEAARNVSPSCQDKIPDIDWPGLIGLRNVLVHQYFRLDIQRIWEIATIDVPPLISYLEPYIPTQEPT